MSISALVKQRREALKVSQADLAWLARVSRGTIGNIERGAVGSDSRKLPTVTHALGLDYLDTVQSGEAVERVPLFVARRIIQLILEERDGLRRTQGARKIARLNADEYLEFVEIFEDEDSVAADGDAKDLLADIAEFVVPMLEDKSSADRKVLDWFHDLGWSEDDYDDWEVFSAPGDRAIDAPIAEWLEEEPSSDDDEPNVALPVDSPERSESMKAKAEAFDKLPTDFKKALLEGSVAGHITRKYKGGMAGAVFMIPPADEIDTQQVLLSMNRWWQANHWIQGVYGRLETKGSAVIDDPLAIFDAIEVSMITHAERPDILDYIREKYPNRIEELSSRYPEIATLTYGGDEDGSTE
ncbi:helix-turn-helix transcriptional regulator [Nocardiopsis sp. TNDT3]|uniref:helix-turn-helix transcriptional regulator n=1 Tax=Nocardiopsis sp. TNDT3 TaxID=2249354 RepID=UPI000E3DEAFF|nr:helix-turn-helix domain-containing protein [Nocardiopsis sp. TNDT3]